MSSQGRYLMKKLNEKDIRGNHIFNNDTINKHLNASKNQDNKRGMIRE